MTGTCDDVLKEAEGVGVGLGREEVGNRFRLVLVFAGLSKSNPRAFRTKSS